MNLFHQIAQFWQTKILNSFGSEKTLLELIQMGDIGRARDMMQNRDFEVDEAIKEYNPELHDVKKRPNKYRKGQEPYYTEKLPRGRQRYINEVETFFLLGQNIMWKATSEDTDTAFAAYMDFLKMTRFNATMREAKRLAGAETESAKVYHIYQEDGQPRVKVKVISRSKGYTLRPLIDEWGNMTAFGYGYFLKEGNNTVEHFDIETADYIYRCKATTLGWEVNPIPNPSGKINVIYYRQDKAWRGVQERIDREEMIDSKGADSNNYFADPKLKVTADIVSLQGRGASNSVGEVIQMSSDTSKVEYLVPPEYSTMKEAEKKDLADSILFDSFTPNFSFENLKGLGTLSGEALKRAMVLGYMKRDNLKETYDEMVDREKNLIIAIMRNVMNIPLSEELSRLEIEHEFSEPFAEDKETQREQIATLYEKGLISLDTAIKMLAIVDKPEEEKRKIEEEKAARVSIIEPTVNIDPNNNNS